MDYKLVQEYTELKFRTLDFHIGDRFHEMYSHWVIILGKKDDLLLVFTGHPHPEYEDGVKIMWIKPKDFERKYRYTSMNKYFVDYCKPNMEWNEDILLRFAAKIAEAKVFDDYDFKEEGASI